MHLFDLQSALQTLKTSDSFFLIQSHQNTTIHWLVLFHCHSFYIIIAIHSNQSYTFQTLVKRLTFSACFLSCFLALSLNKINFNHLFISHLVVWDNEFRHLDVLNRCFYTKMNMFKIWNVRSWKYIRLNIDWEMMSLWGGNGQKGFEFWEIIIDNKLVEIILNVQPCLLLLFCELFYTPKLQNYTRSDVF